MRKKINPIEFPLLKLIKRFTKIIIDIITRKLLRVNIF